MSDTTKTVRSPGNSEVPRRSSNAPTIEIHPIDSLINRTAERTQPLAPPTHATVSSSPSVSSARTPRLDIDSLAQAGRILEHLRTQLAELDRREQNLNSQLTTLDQEQRSFRLKVREFEEQVGDRIDAIRKSESRIQERERLCDERTVEIDQAEQELSRGKEALAAERASFKAQLAAEIADERELIATRTAQLEEDREAHDRAAEELRIEIEEAAQERIDLEKRSRFHQEHLDRVREQLREAQTELERDRQRQHIWKERVEESLRLRIAHIRQFRDLLEQRENLLSSREEAWQELRRQAEVEHEQRQEQLDQATAEFDAEQTRLRRDLRRQQETLHSQVQQIEQRSRKLDEAELYVTQSRQQALEDRLAVETVMQSLVSSEGAEEAARRMEQARRALLDFHEQLRISSHRLRNEIDESREQLQVRRTSFRVEREAFAEWVRERQEDLDRRQSTLQSQIAALHQREQTWQGLRNRWRDEKRAAEQVIRGLVEQLEVALVQCEPPENREMSPANHSSHFTDAA
ncbi:MAG: hypothetical protein R3C01_16975 [Planctomycetaceae bacterium]